MKRQENLGKSAFATKPTDVHKRLLELNGFSFKGRTVVTEEAKSKQKAKTAMGSLQSKEELISIFRRSYPMKAPN